MQNSSDYRFDLIRPFELGLKLRSIDFRVRVDTLCIVPNCDGCVLQDAKKGVLFIDFPPVLQLQLKRFEYDFMRDTMVKVG